MNSVDPPVNADAGPSQPKPSDPSSGNITVLANRRFPVPPSYYVEFTPERWKRYKRIGADGGKAQTNKGKGKDLGDGNKIDGSPVILEGRDAQTQEHIDVDDLAMFQPPRIDWIKREDSWNAFGRVYQVRRRLLVVAHPRSHRLLDMLEKAKSDDSRGTRYPQFQTARYRQYVASSRIPEQNH